MTIYQEFYAGQTIDFYDDVPQFPPSDGWTLKYSLAAQFTTPAQVTITLTAAAEGERYRIQAAVGQTQTWEAGKYSWERWVEKAGPILQPLGKGTLKILPRIDTLAQGYDNRSHARKVLEAIEAMMESRASQTQRELVAYTIGSRSQTFDTTDTKEALVSLYSQYKWLVADEDNQAGMTAGLPNKRAVGVRFIR